jgi:hypothetical protein
VQADGGAAYDDQQEDDGGQDTAGIEVEEYQ